MTSLFKALVFSSIFFNSFALAATPSEVANALHQNILEQYPKQTLAALAQLKQAVEKSDTETMLYAFTETISQWKKTQASFVAGIFDEDVSDNPRYIDTFHEGNENLQEQINLALDSTDSVKIAFFKNSQKSINALEILLASPHPNKARVKQATLLVITQLQKNITEIQTAYTKTYKPDALLAAITNQLIASSYKLSAWRLDEAAGFTKKYQGKPDASRLEYPLSQHSLIAIKSILALHKNLLHSDTLDLKDLPSGLANPKIIHLLQAKLNHAIALSKTLKAPLSTKITSTKYKVFADAVRDWHQSIYLLLPDTLNVQGKILDADGD